MKRINQLVVQSDMPNDNNVVWVYGNTAKYYNNGTWTTLGEVELGEVELEIGDSNEIKANNLKKLQSIQTNGHTFFANINYGYGTASWLPASGGNALIITSEGHAVKYTISKDGKVTKVEEFTLKDFASELNNKVDKVKGKQLSTNDYTTAEKNKLASLQNYTLPIATKNTLGGVKAIPNIPNLNATTATIDQVAKVISELITQFRICGLIQV